MYQILVIDDYADVRRLIRMTLEDAELDVFEAENGRVGLEINEAEEIDLIITDLLMPEKEGIETIRELRQKDLDIPVIAISGGGSMAPERLLKYAMDLGANAGLTKPVDMDELTGLVHSLIAERRNNTVQ
jgi:DNA-binding NtrC family response regulator